MVSSFKYSDAALRDKGLSILQQNLGYADMLRFLWMLGAGEGDYLLWQEQTFGQFSVDELYDQAAAYWEQRPRPTEMIER